MYYLRKFRTLKRLGLFVDVKNYNNFLYPLSIPNTEIKDNLDFLVLELPPRYMPMMPNGLGYVYNILLETEIKFQLLDINILMYHQYHSDRLLSSKKIDVALGGNSDDPWDNTNSQDWHKQQIIDYFWPELEKILKKIVLRRPKAVGISLNGNNREVARMFVSELRKKLPDLLLVVGGYDCVYKGVGPQLFKEFDYMVIGEAEMSLPQLVTEISKGRRPRNLPGIVSKFDSEDRNWEAPILDDLDAIDFPRYEWTQLELYQTFKREHLVPITASRGCKWGRCRFCAECFPFRNRSPEKVADEIEYMVEKGFHSFHFNESDVNGRPDVLHKICSEIIDRKLNVRLMGQLRIDKRNTVDYMAHLASAGFKHLRFGVDGWSNRVLQLQRKGYNMRIAMDNLHACHSSGIYTTVNMVIGIPGETDDDIEDMIQNVISCKEYIDCVEGINTLILGAGSAYYLNPDDYKIKFRGAKQQIYKDHPYFIPADLWYSESPYIDLSIRINRLDRICAALHEAGINIGGYTERANILLKERYDATVPVEQAGKEKIVGWTSGF